MWRAKEALKSQSERADAYIDLLEDTMKLKKNGIGNVMQDKAVLYALDLLGNEPPEVQRLFLKKLENRIKEFDGPLEQMEMLGRLKKGNMPLEAKRFLINNPAFIESEE